MENVDACLSNSRLIEKMGGWRQDTRMKVGRWHQIFWEGGVQRGGEIGKVAPRDEREGKRTAGHDVS